MTDETGVDPTKYAKESPSFESVVLTFGTFDAEIRLVIAYAWEYEVMPKGLREFRLLNFDHAGELEQTEVRSGGVFDGPYQARHDEPRTFVVSRENFRRENEGYHAEYCLSDLGCFEFDFEKLRVAKMTLRSVGKSGDRWLYKDEAGEIFDFYDPFGLGLSNE